MPSPSKFQSQKKINRRQKHHHRTNREKKREPPPHATLHLRPDLCAPLFLSGRPQLPVRASLSFSGRRSLSRNFDQRLEVKEVEVCNTYAAIHGFFFRIKICHWFQFKKLQGKSSYGEEELELMDSQVCEVKTGFDESFSKVIHQRTLNNQGHWVVLDKIAAFEDNRRTMESDR
ncbi:hypothetical protein QL285_046987 [Trifolium repens]|nr:hypothetical protein QL285_046987 [Trifolium repens]